MRQITESQSDEAMRLLESCSGEHGAPFAIILSLIVERDDLKARDEQARDVINRLIPAKDVKPSRCDMCGEETADGRYGIPAATLWDGSTIEYNEAFDAHLCGDCAPDVTRAMRRAAMAEIFSACSICRQPHRSDDRHACE